MGKVIAYIGLGSNLGDRERHLEEAVAEIGALPGTRVLAQSSWLENPAVGIPGGGPFLNGALRIETTLSPRELLSALLAIEKTHGRAPRGSGAYENRPLDLDLLIHGDQEIQEEGLTVPHPRIRERDFVLIPLRELGVEMEATGEA
jgi:2-amino-4-hydroxy-6-hydroxymethyldihydropteridine diphosphokinase